MFNDEGTKNEHWTFTAYILYTVGLKLLLVNSNASKIFYYSKNVCSILNFVLRRKTKHDQFCLMIILKKNR